MSKSDAKTTEEEKARKIKETLDKLAKKPPLKKQGFSKQKPKT